MWGTVSQQQKKRQRIAIVGTGISGMSAAWLLNQGHDIHVYEKADRIGGHSNTVNIPVRLGADERVISVDTGFIVYNEITYPNLTAMFDHLGVTTEQSNMSFSASVEDGAFEYSGLSLRTMLAQKRNLFRPRFWNMVWDLMRFFREASDHARRPDNRALTLGEYLTENGYSAPFMRDYLLPLGRSIWSASFNDMLAYPLTAFVRFFENHGLLEASAKNRLKWRTVSGGSQAYVHRLTRDFAEKIHLNTSVINIKRRPTHVELTMSDGRIERFDQVVIAAHSDQALNMLSDASPAEQKLLSAIRYERNTAVLHTDTSLMPKRKKAWASWNYISDGKNVGNNLVSLTYWMNLLQNIDNHFPVFVTLNPHRPPKADHLIKSFEYDHPVFSHAALDAQQELWNLQGVNRTWFCGAYFGHGFHEDGLQAGLAVGEELGGLERPWAVPGQSSRIFVTNAPRVAA